MFEVWIWYCVFQLAYFSKIFYFIFNISPKKVIVCRPDDFDLVAETSYSLWTERHRPRRVLFQFDSEIVCRRLPSKCDFERKKKKKRESLKKSALISSLNTEDAVYEILFVVNQSQNRN